MMLTGKLVIIIKVEVMTDEMIWQLAAIIRRKWHMTHGDAPKK